MEDMPLNYLFALYLLSKTDSLVSSNASNDYTVTKGMNKRTFINLYCFGIGDEINEEEIEVYEPIKLSGRLDIANRDRILNLIKNEYIKGNPLNLDLSNVDYV